MVEGGVSPKWPFSDSILVVVVRKTLQSRSADLKKNGKRFGEACFGT